jgi:polyhydroxyalkanoate synthesis regulator phasin
MLETLREVLLAGLGAGVITQEKAEQATRRFVTEGKLTAAEAKQLTEELLASSRSQWQHFQHELVGELRAGMDRIDVARGTEVELLVRRLENLEQRVKILEDSRS